MKKTYEQCTVPDHDDEFLNMACLDEACSKHQLLCVFCLEEHQSCRKHPLRKFLLEFRQQLATIGQEVQGPQIQDLLQYYDQMKDTMENTQKIINEIFDKTKSTIIEYELYYSSTKQLVQQMSTQTMVKQQQEQKLKEFEATKNQENFTKLLSEIESFKTNPEKFSFTIRKQPINALDKVNERLANAKLCVHQYQSAMNTFSTELLNQQETLKKNLTNFFLNAPRGLQQEVVQEGVNFDKFKSNQLYTPVQQQQIQQEKNDRSIIAIDDDLEELINKDTVKKNGSVQKQTPLSVTDLLEPEDKKTTKQNLPPVKKQPSAPKPQPPQPQQNIPPPPAQPQTPIGGTLDENQNEVETVLNVCQDGEFPMLTNGKDILKLLFLNKDTLAGVGGNQLQVFHASSGTKIFSINIESEITDIGYMEYDDQNGTLYIATRRGKIEVYIRENGESQFQFRQSTILQADKPGILYLSMNQQDKNMITLGEEKMIKVWSVKTHKETKKAEIPEQATAFYTDQKQVFVGGNKFLLIFDLANNTKKVIVLEGRVVGISTCETKLVIGVQDQIKVFELQTGEPQYLYGQKFGMISSMQILKKWPIVLVSSKSSPRVCLYNYEQESSEKLFDQVATYCAVREYDKIYYVAFGKERGGYITYRIEQTVPQSL